MKSLSKKISIVISLSVLTVIALAAAAAVFWTLRSGGQLAVPTNLRVAEEALLWDKVPNADSYTVELNGELRSADESRYPLPNYELGRTFNSRVMARADGGRFFDSAWSLPLSHTVTQQLATPVNLRIAGANFYWDSVPNALSYTVIVSGAMDTSFTTLSPSFSLSNLVYLGSYTITVRANGNGTIFLNSEFSEIVEYTLLHLGTQGLEFERRYDGYYVTNGYHAVAAGGGFVEVPETYNGLPVIGIGEAAFMESELQHITLPDSIREIERNAFLDSWLWHNFPDGLVWADNWIVGHNNLWDYWNDIESCRGIANEAFMGYGYGTFAIASNQYLRYVGKNAFRDSAIDTFVCQAWTDSQLVYIGGGAFRNTMLQYIEVPPSIEYIGENAFADNESMSYVFIGRDGTNGVPALGQGAFDNIYRLSDIWVDGGSESGRAYRAAPVWENYAWFISGISEDMTLATPTGLAINSGYLSWNAVPNAVSYLVEVNGGIFANPGTNSLNIMSLAEPGVYTIRVRALGNSDMRPFGA